MQFYQALFSRLPVIETERLRLRPLQMGDARDMFSYASDDAVSLHVLWDTHRTLADSRAFIRAARRQYRLGLPSTFGITLRDTGRLIGTIGVMWVNFEFKSAEVGYSLAKAQWNQGLMTEALSAVLDYAFSVLHLNRVEAQYETENPASGRVMEKCGMHLEGTLRSRVYNKGRYMDVNLCAILRKEHRADETITYLR